MTFKKKLFGYDPRQADEYIAALREGYAEMEAECAALEAENRRLAELLKAQPDPEDAAGALREEYAGLESARAALEAENGRLEADNRRLEELLRDQPDIEDISRVLSEAKNMAGQVETRSKLAAEDILRAAAEDAAKIVGDARAEASRFLDARNSVERQLREVFVALKLPPNMGKEASP